MEHKNTKNKIITIPNLLSLARIIIIPFIVWTYFCLDNKYISIALIILSGLTDIIDGYIARRFNMISNVGKILDPIADKLTQGTIIICLTLKYVWMRILVIVFVIKEVAMCILGIITIKKVGKIDGAKWYGKVNTVLLYIVMGILVLLPNINVIIANIMIIVSIISVVLSLVMYIHLYKKLWSEEKLKL